jgi:hypothetical protein
MVDRQGALGLPLAKPLDEADIQGFAAALRGDLIRPEDDGYDASRAVFNGMVDRRPALIARCAGVADVMRGSSSPGPTTCRSLSVAGGTASRARRYATEALCSTSRP